MNYKFIAHILGCALELEAACMLLPLICALCYGDSQSAFVFLICAAICAAAGAFPAAKCPKNKAIYSREGFAVVALCWIIMSIFGALPFIISGAIPNPLHALFETASGLTTTGASILSDVEALPKAILFWRSFTHWIGGMGVLVFLVAIVPLAGGSNMYLIKAESPGPAVNKLVPRVRATAKILYGIYLFMTILEIIFLLIGKMPLFDAITISVGTAGTGGFAILNSGLADYSPYVQIVVTVFMIMFGIDFSLYYLILRRQVKAAVSSVELRVYLLVILASALTIAFNCREYFSGMGEALRHSFFQVGSIITTTGYSTTDFDRWPELSKTILIMLMFMGACAGSTGGGIKVSRIIILLKSVAKEIMLAAHPKSTHKICMNGRPLEHETMRAVNVFMVSYLVVFAVSLLIISVDNLDFTTNFTAVAATLNNIGPGLSKVGPTCNFLVYSPLSIFVLTLDMLIGRLEIFPMLILFSPYTWKK